MTTVRSERRDFVLEAQPRENREDDVSIHESGEDYLEAILMLEQKRGYVRAVDIADQLAVSKASVSKALVNLTREGYVTVVSHDVRLTEKGRERARTILERHLFFSELLVSVGVDPGIASEEACRMEHCLSEDSFRKLRMALEAVFG